VRPHVLAAEIEVGEVQLRSGVNIIISLQIFLFLRNKYEKSAAKLITLNKFTNIALIFYARTNGCKWMPSLSAIFFQTKKLDPGNPDLALHFARTSSLVRMARTARSFASSFNRAA
jgi:hypothetical protein